MSYAYLRKLIREEIALQEIFGWSQEELMIEASWNPFSAKSREDRAIAQYDKEMAKNQAARDAQNQSTNKKGYDALKARFRISNPEGTRSDFLSFIQSDFGSKASGSHDPDENAWYQSNYPIDVYKKMAAEDKDLRESARLNLGALKRIIREEIVLQEIFGWSKKEKEEAEESERVASQNRDAAFARESQQNKRDWAQHGEDRSLDQTRDGVAKINALKEKIGTTKLKGILGPNAERDKSGNPQMNKLSEDDLKLVAQIFRIGSELNHPWNVNPLGITVSTFVPYVSHYMNSWKPGSKPAQKDVAQAYAGTARANKEKGIQGTTTHPAGSAKERRRGPYTPSWI